MGVCQISSQWKFPQSYWVLILKVGKILKRGQVFYNDQSIVAQVILEWSLGGLDF